MGPAFLHSLLFLSSLPPSCLPSSLSLPLLPHLLAYLYTSLPSSRRFPLLFTPPTLPLLFSAPAFIYPVSIPSTHQPTPPSSPSFSAHNVCELLPTLPASVGLRFQSTSSATLPNSGPGTRGVGGSASAARQKGGDSGLSCPDRECAWSLQALIVSGAPLGQDHKLSIWRTLCNFVKAAQTPAYSRWRHACLALVSVQKPSEWTKMATVYEGEEENEASWDILKGFLPGQCITSVYLVEGRGVCDHRILFCPCQPTEHFSREVIQMQHFLGVETQSCLPVNTPGTITTVFETSQENRGFMLAVGGGV